MIWILTVMMWYEGDQTRNTYLQDIEFISVYAISSSIDVEYVIVNA